jgi:hypothetical protein
MRGDQRIDLIVYGDFNCPFSALASARVHRLEQLGRARVDWRAVEHAPEIPTAGHEVVGELRAELRRELAQIRGLLAPDEPDVLELPSIQSNTGPATAAYAAAPESERSALRIRLFTAYWSEAADLADPTILTRLGAREVDDPAAARWREQWLCLSQPIVPAVVLPDGHVSRGLGGLARLGQLARSAPRTAEPDNSRRVDRGAPIDPADLGGESPCFAHLLDDQPD